MPATRRRYEEPSIGRRIAWQMLPIDSPPDFQEESIGISALGAVTFCPAIATPVGILYWGAWGFASS